MAQSVILYSCDLERSRSTVRSIKFCTAMRTLPMSRSIHMKFRWNLIASCLDTVNKSLTEKWPGEEERKDKKKQFDWTFTLCDTKYAMKERSDIKVTIHNLKIFPWTFIWHGLGLNTLSRYRDRAAETLPKIMGIVIAKQEDYLNKKKQFDGRWHFVTQIMPWRSDLT